MKLVEEQANFAEDVAKLITYIFELGYKCTFGETFRTQEQAEIYAKEGKGIKNSLHRKRLAIDLNLFDSNGFYITKIDNKIYPVLGTYWESLDPKNKWGGNFKSKDGNHFERHV